MMRAFSSLLIGCGVVPVAVMACGGNDGASAPGEGISTGDVASQSDGLAWRIRFRTRARPVAAVITGTGGSPAPVPTGGGASPAPNTQDVVAAAQTADGQAIPQGSLAGGQCPAVVAALGFWSCITIGDACTFSSGGVTHHCTCSRVDGEGQAPAWVCD